MIMLGMAWQNGLIPVSDAAIYEANRLNKVKVKENAAAFDLGRIAAVKPTRSRRWRRSGRRSSRRSSTN